MREFFLLNYPLNGQHPIGSLLFDLSPVIYHSLNLTHQYRLRTVLSGHDQAQPQWPPLVRDVLFSDINNIIAFSRFFTN